MIKYTCKDIIKRAKSLADMSDTSFLSYKELTDYLNLAWKQVCQAAINKGCKYFLKTVEVNGSGTFELPWDFYQMDTLRTSSGVVLPRHTNSMSDGAFSYDIIGNSLIVYGATSYGLEMRYWTVPDLLTFPAEDKELDDLPDDIIGLYGTKVVYKSNNTIMYKDFSTDVTGEVTTYSDGMTFPDVMVGKSCVWLRCIDKEGTETWAIAGLNGKALWSSLNEEYIPVMYSNGMVFPGKYADGTLTVYMYDSTEKEKFTLVQEPATHGVYISNDKVFGVFNNVLYEMTSGVKYADNISNNRAVLCEWDNNDAVMINSHIYWDVNGKVFTESCDINEPIIYGPLKADWDTGYGWLVNDGMNDIVKTFVPDTELDFPNTLMFEYMAYILAYYFVLKQSADTESISSALNTAELAFYDSLDNGSAYPTITNVYKG